MKKTTMAAPNAIALAGMAVAGLEQRARRMDGQKQPGSGDESLVVHVAAVDRRRRAVVAAEGGGRGDAHAAEEGGAARRCPA